jgi:hypothetical protein
VARSLTAALVAAMFAERTNDGPLLLLTITHPTLAVPIRLCADGVDHTSRGHVFSAFPFDVTLPDDQEDQPAVARLTADNVSRRIVPLLRSLPDAPLATVEIVKFSDVNTVEITLPRLQMSQPQRPDPMSFSCDLTLIDTSIQRYPRDRYYYSHYPALARAVS